MSDYIVDQDRLDQIAALDLFGDTPAALLDSYATRAAERFDMPTALVSIVLDSAQYIAGSHGLDGWISDAQGTPVEWAFCANVVRNRADYIVEDATTDPLQHDNPLVIHDGIRSYAGAPLTTAEGHILGSYCVVGDQPRAFTPDEVTALHDMADDLMRTLQRDHQIGDQSVC